MKRIFSLLIVLVVAGASTWAAPAQPSLKYVKATHERTRHHHAHKAAKHHRVKHSHNGV